jgi:hypothetical protein
MAKKSTRSVTPSTETQWNKELKQEHSWNSEIQSFHVVHEVGKRKALVENG